MNSNFMTIILATAAITFVAAFTALVGSLAFGSIMDGVECHRRTGFYHCTQAETNTTFAEIKVK